MQSFSQRSSNKWRAMLFLVLLHALAADVLAQQQRLVPGEPAYCTIIANNKTYVLTPNQVGSFDRVFNFSPGQLVPVEVTYPNGRAGDKVVVAVEDGGSVDSKGVLSARLDNQKKIRFQFQVFDIGMHEITLKKDNDIKTIQLYGGSVAAAGGMGVVAANGDDGGSPSGNDGSHGKDQNANKCKQKEGDPFDPYTGNELRNVTDLEIWGGTGETKLEWSRYGNSHNGKYKRYFGNAFSWNHSYKFDMADAGTDTSGQLQISIHYPEGGQEFFTQSLLNPAEWTSTKGVANRVYKDSNNYYLQMPTGYRYRFEKLKDTKGNFYYQLQDFKDQFQNKYSFLYDSSGRMVRITEPAGRYLQMVYGLFKGVEIIKQVNSSDGRNVRYHYKVFPDTVTTWVVLDTVYYGDGTRARYAYSQNAPGIRPVLAHAIDPRYSGNDVNMKYIYDTARNFVGFISQELNGVTNEVMVTLTTNYNAGVDKRYICYANGKKVVISYPSGEQGRVSNYSDGLGRKTHNTFFEQTGFLKSQTDPLGRTTIYDSVTIYNNPIKITHPDGSTESWTRDNLDLILTHTDELGRVTTYSRDTSHRVTRITYPTGSYETFTYNSFGQVLDHRLRNGGTEHYVYDSRGLRTSYTDAFGNTTLYTYDGADRLATLTDARSNSTGYSYNERGLMTKTTNADGTVKTYGYDEFGNRTSVTDELGHTWSTHYDEFRRPDSLTDPLGRLTRYTYDLPGGICGCMHDQNKATGIILPSGKTTAYTYDVEWQLIVQTTGAGSPDAATTYFEYNLAGKLVTVTDPKGNDWTTTYNKRDWKISATDPLGNKTTWVYDKTGNITKVIRPNGGTTSNVYDAMNRVTKTTDPKGQVTKMNYDAADNLTKLTDPKGNAYTFKYDLLNRRTSMIYPDATAEKYTYDKVSNLRTYTNRGGSVRTYVYDNRNRETKSSWDDGTTPSITRTYDAAGRALKITSSVSTLRFGYDNANQLTRDTQNVAGTGNKILIYTYNADGLQQSVMYPSGNVVSYDYTSRNQLDSVGAGGTDALVRYTYDPNGNRISKTLENGTAAFYGYDDANRMLTVDNKQGSTSFARFDYGYDNVDRRTYMQRDNALGDVYHYDAIDQVTDVRYDAANPNVGDGTSPARLVYYDWDAAGNRNSVTDNSSTTPYQINNLNQYTQVGSDAVQNDILGNLKSFNAWTYQYDAQNRLTGASNGSTTTAFKYDALNRCVQRTINGTATFLYYDGWNLIEERSSSNALLQKYIHGAQTDEILKKLSKAVPYYYHHDALGNVIKLTNTTGTVAEQYSYDVFGKPAIKDKNGNALNASAVGNRFMFTGREYLAELKLYDYRNRMYSDSLGRFLQTDPLGVLLSDQNLYRYTRNNPVKFNDAYGLIFGIDDAGAALIIAGAAALGGAFCFGYIQGIVDGCDERTESVQNSCKKCEEFVPYEREFTCLTFSYKGPCGGYCKKQQ